MYLIHEEFEKLKQNTEKIVQDLGLELYDIDISKKFKDIIIKIIVDKEENVTVGECTGVNKRVNHFLMDLNFNQLNYIIEVNSPGLDRVLKKEKDFVKYKDKKVKVKTKELLNGQKVFFGLLIGLIDNKIIVLAENGGELAFDKESIDFVKLVI